MGNLPQTPAATRPRRPDSQVHFRDEQRPAGWCQLQSRAVSLVDFVTDFFPRGIFEFISQTASFNPSGFHFHLAGLACFSLSTIRNPCSVNERKVVFSFRARRWARSNKSSAISMVVFIIWRPIFAWLATHIKWFSRKSPHWWPSAKTAATAGHPVRDGDSKKFGLEFLPPPGA